MRVYDARRDFGLTFFLFPFLFLFSYALSNFKQRESRAVAIAIVNGYVYTHRPIFSSKSEAHLPPLPLPLLPSSFRLGNLASVYGSYIWPSKSAPKYKLGFGCTTGCEC